MTVVYKINLAADDIEKESIALKAPVISYGADYTIDSLSQYVKNQDIVIQPSFQRNFVWDIKKASKLIESFLLGYPVPNILLGRPQNDDRMEVIDGQQRIRTVTDYLSGTFNGETVFRLTGEIVGQFANKTFSELDESDQRRLRNAVMKAIVLVYQDSDPDLKYTVFQRINAGSVILNQQEIRNCIYGGSLNDLLGDLNTSATWRSFFSKKADKRMRDEETILRFFAAYFNRSNYEQPMTSFLNKFMSSSRFLDETAIRDWRRLFDDTLTIIAANYSGKNPFSLNEASKQFNRAVFEAIMTAVATLEYEGKSNFDDFSKKHKLLISNPEFVDSVSTGTSAEKKYSKRISLAYETLK